MKAFSITDIGRLRFVNQDYVYCEENSIGNLPNLFIVADGMGGHNAGDFASKYCVEHIVSKIKESKKTTPVGILEEAVREANDGLLWEADEQESLEGMGTTVVAATISDNTMYVANMGDSRLYVMNDTITQITQDHSLVEEMIKNGEISREEARFHPNKNIITRALGSYKYVSPDYFEIELKQGDIILLCSDGLSNMIDDQEIKDIVMMNSNDIRQAAEELVKRANYYGGRDNIAVILIQP